MATLTEMVAAVVIHSSAVAYSHLGVTLEPPRVERATPASERTVARTPRRPEKLATCPDEAPQRPQRTAGVRA